MNLAGNADEVKIYTIPRCSFCIRAKQLLNQKGTAYNEIDVSGNLELRRELQLFTSSRNVPQIFINGKLIGGCSELFTLERRGILDNLLKEIAHN